MIEFQDLPVSIVPMQVEDIGEVLEIERVSFLTPWSARAYDYELRYNDLAHYYIARQQKGDPTDNNGWRHRGWWSRFFKPAESQNSALIVGYVGFWLMAGEAHISTIAVRPEFRGRHIGELILAASLDAAADLGAHEATLEVRVSNQAARGLYKKYGFVEAGVRRGYYTDNNEDALIMTTPLLKSEDYQQNFQRLKSALLLRLRQPLEDRSARQRERVRGG